MPQSSIVKYIREQIKAGYDVKTIKKYLLKYGYTEARINEALKAIHSREVKHIIHPSKTTIALVIAVIFSLAFLSLAIFIFLIPEKAPSKLLDVRINHILPAVKQDETLQFTIEIFNLGKAKRYDVPIKYEIYNLKDELITFKEETLALETRASSSVNIKLSNIKPGSYYLKATAFYNQETAKATSSFKVIKKDITPATKPPTSKQEPRKRCPSSCNDNNECTNDYCSETTNYQCKNDVIFPCCGNNICEDNENYENCIPDCPPPRDKVDSILEGKTIWERLDIIKGIANSDKKKALEYCKEIEQIKFRYECFTNIGVSSEDEDICLEIEDDPSKNDCYKEIAKEIQNSDVCSKITKDSKRDQCYTDFVTKGDYTVCDKLINKYIKRGCESLKKLSETSSST